MKNILPRPDQVSIGKAHARGLAMILDIPLSQNDIKLFRKAGKLKPRLISIPRREGSHKHG